MTKNKREKYDLIESILSLIAGADVSVAEATLALDAEKERLLIRTPAKPRAEYGLAQVDSLSEPVYYSDTNTRIAPKINQIRDKLAQWIVDGFAAEYLRHAHEVVGRKSGAETALAYICAASQTVAYMRSDLGSCVSDAIDAAKAAGMSMVAASLSTVSERLRLLDDEIYEITDDASRRVKSDRPETAKARISEAIEWLETLDSKFEPIKSRLRELENVIKAKEKTERRIR